MRTVRTWTAIVAILQATATAAAAQDRQIEISGIPACTTCTIEMVKIATIGGPGAPGAPALLGDFSHIGRGPLNTFVAASYDGTQLFVFDSAGNYLRAAGRLGQSGGEFRQVLGEPVVYPVPLGLGRADTLFVRSAGQLMVYTPQFEFVRSVALPSGPYIITPLPHGNIVFASSRTAPNLNLVLLLDASANTVGTFGIAGDENPAECIRCFGLDFAVDISQRSVLVSHPNRYVVERFDFTGRPLLAATVVNSPWMRDWKSGPVPGTEYFVRPEPEIVKAVSASANRVWIVAHVPSANWTVPGPPGGSAAGGFLLKNGAISYVYALNSEASRDKFEKSVRNTATVLELIDLDRGQLIASKTFDAAKYESVDGDLFAVRRIDRDGITTFDVFRLQFTER